MLGAAHIIPPETTKELVMKQRLKALPKVLELLQAGIYIDDNQIKSAAVRLGIEAPDSVVLLRGDLNG
jgi:hypothetical protein